MGNAGVWTPEAREALEAVFAAAGALAGIAQGDRRTNDSGTVPADEDTADPLRALFDGCLDGLAAVGRLDACSAALKVRLAADCATAAKSLAAPSASAQWQTAQEMSLVSEVACVLTVGERTAGALLADSLTLTTKLPLTLSALQEGSISWQHARVVVDETSNLDAAGAAGLEAHFLDPDAVNPARGCPAGELVASRFRHKARTWRERHHAESIEQRHTRSLADRRLECTPDRDGMAWLSAYLPADQAAGIWDRTTAAARALQGPAESRTLGQLRADIAATLLLAAGTMDMNTVGEGRGEVNGAARGPAAGMTGDMGRQAVGDGVPSPRAQVLITVPVFSLLGLTDEPATLDGYGPIPPSMARQLIAEGAESFHRVLTDPRDGAPLEIGRTSYRVTKAQRQWLRLRDGKCPFPGCSNHSLDNEADHLLAWAHGGTTGILNLGSPCPRHHRLRHTTGWTPEAATKNEPPGWISPSGRYYASEHPDWEPPSWPEPWPGNWSEHGPELILHVDAGVSDDQLPDDELSDYALFLDEAPPGCPLPEDPYPNWQLVVTA